MEVFIAAAFLMLVLAIPMKFAGDVADTERSGYGWCLLILLVCVALIRAAVEFTGPYAPLAAFLAVTITVATIMGTSFWRASLISLFVALVTLGFALAAQQYAGVDLATLIPEKVKPVLVFADL